jgi:hypothetical protein
MSDNQAARFGDYGRRLERTGGDAVRAALRAQRAARPEPPRLGHPLEYDERGFPITQPTASFPDRVRRLLAE